MSTETDISPEMEEKEETENLEIYLYFKEHPTVFITCISVLLAVASGVINMLIDSQVYKTLRYWGFSSVTVNTTNTHWFYRLILFAVMLVLCFFTLNTVSSICKGFFKRTEYLRKLKQLYKIEKKELARIKKDNQKYQLRLNQIPDSEDGIEEMREKLEWLKTQHEKSSRSHEEAREGIKQIDYILVITIVSSMLTMICAVGFLYSALFSIMFSEWMFSRNSILLGVVLTVAMCAVPLHNAFFDRPRYSRKALHEFKTDSEKLRGQITQTTLEVAKRVDELSNPIGWRGIPNLFCNKNIYMGIVYYVFILGMLVFFGVSTINTSVENQKEFDIFQDSDATYAIIYASNGIYYMDEAEINDDIISINIEKHRIMKSDDIQYDKQCFSYVLLGTNKQEERNNESITISTSGDDAQ